MQSGESESDREKGTEHRNVQAWPRDVSTPPPHTAMGRALQTQPLSLYLYITVGKEGHKNSRDSNISIIGTFPKNQGV